MSDDTMRAGDWRPIETAPLDGTAVLLYVPGQKSWHRLTGMPDMMIGMWTNQNYTPAGWFGDYGDVDQGYESTGAYFEHERLDPTHWMPLPPPPRIAPTIDPDGEPIA